MAFPNFHGLKEEGAKDFCDNYKAKVWFLGVKNAQKSTFGQG